MGQGESPLRVFISYSHDDSGEFAAVCEALRAAGAEPWSDANIAAGRGLTHQIQSYIAHSHVFVPILTPRSHARGWVHQEIGFAVAMKVPCVPSCIGQTGVAFAGPGASTAVEVQRMPSTAAAGAKAGELRVSI